MSVHQKTFSVLMSVYFKETVSNLEQSILSIINQTLPPNEIVLVKDGPLTLELDNRINDFKIQYPNLFKIIELPENKGLGNALAIGLTHCTYDIVARMDTDDIAVNNRFEKQLNFLSKHPEIDVLGCNIEEFNSFPGDLKRFKINPQNHEALIEQIKLKSPFNHPSIVFKKNAILNAGNYDGSLPLFEDYSLFLRLMLTGAHFYNLQEYLLFFRVKDGVETIKRRSGVHYLRKELKFVNFAVKIGAFSKLDRLVYVTLKFPVRLLPPKVALFVYNTFLRKSSK